MTNLKQLEVELEHLRSKIQRQVGSNDKKLRDPDILPLSKALDELIVLYMKEKLKTNDE